MQTWNDFFSDRPVKQHTKETNCRTYDDFEHDYRKKYGLWFDHHYFKLIQEYGTEKADKIIQANVDALNKEILQSITENESTFVPIPESMQIPF